MRSRKKEKWIALKKQAMQLLAEAEKQNNAAVVDYYTQKIKQLDNLIFSYGYWQARKRFTNTPFKVFYAAQRGKIEPPDFESRAFLPELPFGDFVFLYSTFDARGRIHVQKMKEASFRFVVEKALVSNNMPLKRCTEFHYLGKDGYQEKWQAIKQYFFDATGRKVLVKNL